MRAGVARRSLVHGPTLTRAALIGTSFFALTGAALAQPAIGLAGDKTLVMFDTETLAVEGMMDVTGVDRLHGIDQRPADGMVYGVDGENNIVTIDLDVRNQRGEPVMTMRLANLVELRDPSVPLVDGENP